MFSVRYFSDSDIAFWLSLDKHISESELILKIRDNRGYIISDNELPVGIMRYNLFWDNTPFLTFMHFKETSQRKGFGRQAMAHWENEMRELGFNVVMTSTQADEQAQHFYRKLGYIDRGCLILDNTPIAQPLEIFMIKTL